ncbi:transketolase [Listeria fleischmannii]|uniref:Transketolase n=1 Tax=Listeria fleischmannii FSL S10-1203 TaxID=1265822 RepID=W7DCN1_9LIST|nr:transketolase [Listeria fleischmannii]EUJ47047.1 transketolase [Listeria fleischmannii FSL S10-1203]
MKKTMDQQVIDNMRALSIDMIEKAKSGHPGMPMGAAPMAYMLFAKHLKFNPKNPNWFNRDRFVLSAGHGSALLYSALHLFGYDVSMEDLKAFRQFGSKTPGHPEYRFTAGVDVTSGPLGQGIAMAAGMALAEAKMADSFNKENYDLVDHYTYAICGDGDLMEGVASEAASLAGHLGLGKLIVLYDSNDISLDGELSASFSEDAAKRFGAYGWQVLQVCDGNNLALLQEKLVEAKADKERPTLIEVKTVIGYGAPNKGGSSACHGAPLGDAEASLAKENYGFTEAPFTVRQEVKDYLSNYRTRGAELESAWENVFSNYEALYPELAAEFKRVVSGELPENWDVDMPSFMEGEKVATRSASHKMINSLAASVPEFFGGSADLGCSNKTFIDDGEAFTKTKRGGRNIWFGVREFAMAAMLNGMALHGGLRVFGSTFFVFSDYMRPAIRMAALMKLPVTYVFTHDSIAVGEDGPTHEPIEHLASLRAMPGLSVLRPADAKETRVAWEEAMQNQDGPVALVLSRQDLPVLETAQETVTSGVKKGAYIVSPSEKEMPDAILIATGSEVSLAIAAQNELKSRHIDVSVVSLPSFDIFKQQSKAYQESVLPNAVRARFAIEAASTFGWHDIIGDAGEMLGIDHFGASAPAERLFEAFGFTKENVADRVQKLVEKVGVRV